LLLGLRHGAYCVGYCWALMALLCVHARWKDRADRPPALPRCGNRHCRSWRLACGAVFSVNKISLENGLAVTRAILGAKTYQRRFIAENRLLALGPPQSLAVKLECLEPAAARRAHATITGRVWE